MPTYDYICRTCGHRFEYVQRITADALEHCPVEECILEEKGKGEVQRVVSGGVGLVFKGEGFYLTDYGRKGEGGAKEGKGGGAKSGAGGSSKDASSTSSSESKGSTGGAKSGGEAAASS